MESTFRGVLTNIRLGLYDENTATEAEKVIHDVYRHEKEFEILVFTADQGPAFLTDFYNDKFVDIFEYIVNELKVNFIVRFATVIETSSRRPILVIADHVPFSNLIGGGEKS